MENRTFTELYREAIFIPSKYNRMFKCKIFGRTAHAPLVKFRGLRAAIVAEKLRISSIFKINSLGIHSTYTRVLVTPFSGQNSRWLAWVPPA